MDLIQASGRWLYYFGLRSRGYENFEPANAMTRQTQQELQQELQSMSEWNLGMMNRALLRLMGMLFIEAARTLIHVQELRMRESATETVEVEVDEEDDVSLYVQLNVVTRKRSWGELLEHLLRMAEDGTPGRKELMEALKRRISQSLFLQGERGTQLHAALVAITGDLKQETVTSCDTADNDAPLIERLWSELKGHLSLEATPGEARGSEDNDLVMFPLADPGHRDSEVQKWEEERQEEATHLAAEFNDVAAEARAREEENQNERDVQLFLDHERQSFRDWESWVVLNTPNTQKRRRLTFAIQQDTGKPQGSPPVSIWLPQGQAAFTLNVNYDQVEMPPSTTSVDQQTQVPIDSVTYDKAYQAWKDGFITNEGVERIFGGEWLFLFQLTSRGVEQDTMAPMMMDADDNGAPLHGLPPASMDIAASQGGEDRTMSVALTVPDEADTVLGGVGQWTQQLQNAEGVVLEVGDSSLEMQQDGDGSLSRDTDENVCPTTTNLEDQRGRGQAGLEGNGEGTLISGGDGGAGGN